MAVLHKGTRTLNGQARQYLMTCAACIIMLTAYILMMIQGREAMEFKLWYAFLPVLWVIGTFYYWQRYRRFKAGAQGESELLEYLRQLPDQYHIFSNYQIREKRIRDEVDFIVIGGSGVFVIEAKNHVGRITGKTDDIEWVQHKLGRHGKPITRNMMNPVKQSHWHTVNIARLLHKLGHQLMPTGVLVFTNPNVSLGIETEGVVVQSGCEAIVPYILNHVTLHRLSKQQIKQITDVLEQESKK